MERSVVGCHLDANVSIEELTAFLAGRECADLIEQYRGMIDEDPEYLDFHCTTAMLRVQAALKEHGLGPREIGVCEIADPCACCVLAALRNAVGQGNIPGWEGPVR